MQSWYDIRARASGAEVLIYDEIGAYGVSAKGFLAELGALPEGTPIDLRLNSPGGSVFDAVAIHNALTRHTGTITVWIDGIAASAASYIAMAGDEIVMPENAFLMIHDPSGVVMGTAADMREMAGTMDKIAASMTRGYAARSGRSEPEIAALMAAETWFDAQDALEVGLATRMIEPVRIAASFDVARFRNAPPALVEVVEADGIAPNADSTVPDADTVEAEPESLAEDKTFDPAQDDAPPSGGHAGDVGDPNIPSVETGSTVAPASTAPDPSAGLTASPAPDPAAIRAEALAHARAVIDLCRLAGQPQMAGRFLEENASLEAVRASLLASRASMAETTPEISPHHPQPGPGPSARPWGDVIARTFKLKG
jgi:ATP-dependent Clp protease, protease subunit